MNPQTITAYVLLDSNDLASRSTDKFFAAYLLAMPGHLSGDPRGLRKFGRRCGRIITRAIKDSDGDSNNVIVLLSGILDELKLTGAS